MADATRTHEEQMRGVVKSVVNYRLRAEDGAGNKAEFVIEFNVVPAAGVEPARLAARDFKFLAYPVKSTT